MREINFLTDDKNVIIKELQKEFADKDIPDEVKPPKYDQGTGTYYTDEELAREKLKPIELLPKENNDIPQKESLENMLQIFVDRSNQSEDVIQKKGFSMGPKPKESRWHS